MKLREDFVVDFDREALMRMVINAMTSMIQEFLDTGQQDLFVAELGTISSPDWAGPLELSGTHVSFVYTGNVRAAVISESKVNYAEPPDWDLPVREWLGRALLRDGQYIEAEKTYREEIAQLFSKP